MRKIAIGIATLALAFAGGALAKLPAPTEAQQEAAKAAAAKAAEAAKKEAEALGKVQDMVAERYKKAHAAPAMAAPAAKK